MGGLDYDGELKCVLKRIPTDKELSQEFCQLYISIILYNPHQTVAKCFLQVNYCIFSVLK